jgi:Ring hydroxylating alpha subunit (catalytic domain)
LNVYYDTQFWPPHSSHMIQSNPDWVPEGNVLKFVSCATGASQLRVLNIPSGKPQMTKLSDYKGINPIGMPNFWLRYLYVFPFAQLMVLDHSYVLSQVWPLGPDKTRFIHRSYFRAPPASYIEEFGQAHMMACNRDLFSEDSAVTRSQYRALKSGGMKQLFLGENELLSRHMHAMVQAYLNDRAPSCSSRTEGQQAV